MFSDALSRINFWGWNAIIVAAAITLPLGLTTSKEYAELEWPIDIAIAAVWVVFTINLIGTILRRREKHLYVAIWFYIATAITVALLHIVNSLEVPAGAFKSYSIYAGVQDALVQWWYGHNAVAFFLTTPYLGLMYYFLPKAAERPVFSYRLSIIHFWALIFIYIWAGPHHLLYTALPDWAQSLGMVFSLMLIAPSWGGMLNGLLTLRGAWDKVCQDPMLKFMVVAVTAYGMATLEGPMLAIKSVNSLSHYTDWTIAHVHTGALGWNGFLTFSMLYWLFPRLYNTKLWSTKLANYHFWIALLGMMFYVVPMYASGITQGLMWKQFNSDGFLQYPNFLETVLQIVPLYRLRAIGGSLYIVGAFLMAFNVWKTARSGQFVPEQEVQAPPLSAQPSAEASKGHWGHRWLEAKPLTFTVLALVAVGPRSGRHPRTRQQSAALVGVVVQPDHRVFCGVPSLLSCPAHRRPPGGCVCEGVEEKRRAQVWRHCEVRSHPRHTRTLPRSGCARQRQANLRDDVRSVSSRRRRWSRRPKSLR